MSLIYSAPPVSDARTSKPDASMEVVESGGTSQSLITSPTKSALPADAARTPERLGTVRNSCKPARRPSPYTRQCGCRHEADIQRTSFWSPDEHEEPGECVVGAPLDNIHGVQLFSCFGACGLDRVKGDMVHCFCSKRHTERAHILDIDLALLLFKYDRASSRRMAFVRATPWTERTHLACRLARTADGAPEFDQRLVHVA